MNTYFHELKIQPEHFEALASSAKTFEIRLNDRNYKIGDLLILREWLSGFYTGREEQKYITHILQSEFLQEGYVGLSLSNNPVLTDFSDFDYGLEDPCLFDSEQSSFLDSFTKSDSAVFGVSREGRSGAAQNRPKKLYVPVTRKVSSEIRKINNKSIRS